jgi:hypothetical protein
VYNWNPFLALLWHCRWHSLCLWLDKQIGTDNCKRIQSSEWVAGMDMASGGESIPTGPEGHWGTRTSELQITWHNHHHKWLLLHTLKAVYQDTNLSRLSTILLQNNAHPHVARWVQYQLNAMWWEVHEYPAHHLDLPPCDFHIFELLQKALEGCTFTWHSDVREAVAPCLRQQPLKFLVDGVYRLVNQWDSSQMPVVILA